MQTYPSKGLASWRRDPDGLVESEKTADGEPRTSKYAPETWHFSAIKPHWLGKFQEMDVLLKKIINQ